MNTLDPAALRDHPCALTFDELRQANLTRAVKWHPRGLSEWSLSDWFTATMGELGEAANVAKKLNRVRDDIPGNSESEPELRSQLADEIADVAIYLDILAASEGIDLAAAIVSKWNATSIKVGFPDRIAPAEREADKAEIERLREALKAIRDHPCNEINMGNYYHDDVRLLNNAWIEVGLIASAALPPPPEGDA